VKSHIQIVSIKPTTTEYEFLAISHGISSVWPEANQASQPSQCISWRLSGRRWINQSLLEVPVNDESLRGKGHHRATI